MSAREWLARISGAFGGGRKDRELGQELRFHLEMLEERHRASGLDAEVLERRLGDALLQAVVRLLDDRKIRKREKCIGVGSHYRAENAAFHQVTNMILAQRPVACEQITQRVILTLQRFGRGHSGQRAELGLADDFDLRLCGVEFVCAFQLVALDVGSTARWRRETFGANHQHRCLRVDVVGGCAAEADDEFARFFPSERAEFASENDELSRERQIAGRMGPGSIRRCSGHRQSR